MKKISMRLPRLLASGAALATGLLLHAPANAQYRQGGQDGPRWEQGQRQDSGQRLDRQVARLTERLRLSSAQAQQIRGILQRQDQEFRAWRESHRDQLAGERRDRAQGGQGQRPELPAELKAIRDRSEQQIERVLSSSQLAEYRKLREERGRWGDRRGGEGRGGHEGHEAGQQRGGSSR